MIEGYTLRLLTPCDLDRLEELERQCFSCPWSRDSLAGDLALACACWLAAVDNNDQVCAYLGAHQFDEEAEIVNLATDPAHRRHGLGRALLLDYFRRTPALRTVFLEVRKSNATAIGLYTQLSFRSIGVRRQYYEHPTEDAIIMRLKLETNHADTWN